MRNLKITHGCILLTSLLYDGRMVQIFNDHSEDITYQRVNVAPPRNSLRTCAAWGDMFQFSNGKGDVLIRGNTFIGCGIEINPQTRPAKPEEPVHGNIRITDNYFDGAGVSAKSVKERTVTGNRYPGGTIQIRLEPTCSETKIEHNHTKKGTK